MEEQRKQNVASHSLESEFVSYEQAVALKELGFDEVCFSTYTEDQILIPYCNGTYYFPAPLKQQVFRFFRGKFNFFGLVEGGYDNGKNLFTYVIWRGGFDDCMDEYWHTYEEAESACIDKLIEIAKQQ